MRERLIAALEQSDAMRREARADRLIWLSGNLGDTPGLISGAVDTLTVRNEAKDCFADGYFIAALLLAFGFIEHALTEELRQRGLVDEQKKHTMAQLLDLAEKHSVFSAALLTGVEGLREIRNSYPHLKEPGSKFTLGHRFIEKGSHPQAVLEGDAKQALTLMEGFFRATLST